MWSERLCYIPYILTNYEGAVDETRLEYLYIQSSDNLWFERHFVSQKFHYYVTFLFMRGENLYLLNRKNLNAILSHNSRTLYVATLYI